MRLLYDFISSLIWSKEKVSAFLVAPPESGKSFSYKLFAPLEQEGRAQSFTAITSAALLIQAKYNPSLDFILISDLASIIHKKIDYSLFNIMLEASEEGVSSYYTKEEQHRLEQRKRFSFVISMTPNDEVILKKKLRDKISLPALYSRFIFFRYTLTPKYKLKMLQGKVPYPTLNIPKTFISSDKDLLKHIIKRAYEFQIDDLIRVVKKIYHLSLAFEEFYLDQEMAKRFADVLIFMKGVQLNIQEAESYVYEGTGLNVDLVRVKSAIISVLD